MRIVLIGRKQKKILDFNDELLAMKFNNNGKQTYYKITSSKVNRLFNKKAKQLVDALIESLKDDK